jgi:type II restriction enzyme
MGKIYEAQEILRELGLPPAQYNESAALTFLSLANIKEDDPWRKAEPIRRRIHDIIIFIKDSYGREYAENTRETIRRQVIHQFEQARIVNRNPDNPFLSTNSPRTHYALTDEIINLIREYGGKGWNKKIKRILGSRKGLWEIYQRERKLKMVPVKLPTGKNILLSPGKHNELQAAVIEQFGPRFAPSSRVAYIGDTARKTLHLDERLLQNLKIPVSKHDKLPDIVFYDNKRNYLFLIEAVTSHGPVSPKRQYELENMLKDCTAKRIYVSAFPNFKEFKRHLDDIAWETEVWLSEIPDHLIHFNGDKFL